MPIPPPPADAYDAPGRSGVVRLRPGSAGSVEGEDDDKDFNRSVLDELDAELSSEISLIKSGRPVSESPKWSRGKNGSRGSSRKTLIRPPVAAAAGAAGSPPEEEATQLLPAMHHTKNPNPTAPGAIDGGIDTPYVDLLFNLVQDARDSVYEGLTSLYLSGATTRVTFRGKSRQAAFFKQNDIAPPQLMNREGFHIPSTNFHMFNTAGLKEERTSESLFANKRVVVFAGPAAFESQTEDVVIPRYNELWETFAKNDVDAIYHVSVNDAFVMRSWGKKLQCKNVTLLPDGSGHFTRGMGMLVTMPGVGLGRRSWRYSMLVDNCEIKKMFVEPQDDKGNDTLQITDADTMLNHINPNAGRPQFCAVFTREDCHYSERVCGVLKAKGWSYEELVVGQSVTRHTLQALAGTPITPQVFINGRHIGGFEDTERYIRTLYHHSL